MIFDIKQCIFFFLFIYVPCHENAFLIYFMLIARFPFFLFFAAHTNDGQLGLLFFLALGLYGSVWNVIYLISLGEGKGLETREKMEKIRFVIMYILCKWNI